MSYGSINQPSSSTSFARVLSTNIDSATQQAADQATAEKQEINDILWAQQVSGQKPKHTGEKKKKKKGDCNRGADCKFEHPEGAPAERVQARAALGTDTETAAKRFPMTEAQEVADTSDDSTDEFRNWVAY